MEQQRRINRGSHSAHGPKYEEFDGQGIISWCTDTDFEYTAAPGDAVCVLSRTGLEYRGIITACDTDNFILRVSSGIGSTQVCIHFRNVVDIYKV